MTITIEEVIDQIDAWRGQMVAIHPLSGGLTNTNYRVEVRGTPYVVRIPGANTDLLAVDRQNEYHNTLAAAQAGVGARVAHFLPDGNVMVLEFIHGQTMSINALQAPGMPSRIAHSLKQLHAGPRFKHDFNMFRLTEYYLQVVEALAVRMPEGFSAYLPHVSRIEAAMARQPLPTVPCHNDLLAENYIDDGQKLWIVDYEYSGNNDPTFELGNTCQEQQSTEAQIVEMCAAYFGEPFPDKLARMKLNMIMSDVGWALWAAIQAQISTIEFDFWGWAVERWGRATAKMDAASFEDGLAAV
ncbi:MAG: phosphotransferase [Anaerolineales bacterium]|nr:phosphotransferase [Anaerolineales bacterium]